MALILAKTNTVEAAVLSGTLHMPLQGVPTYDVVIDQASGGGFDAGTAVTIACDGGLSLVGTVAEKRAGDFLDTIHVRVVGGKNGMWKTASAKGYMQPGALVKDVLDGFTKDSGESLSSATDSGFQNTNLTSWMVTTRPVSECLDVLLQYVAPDSGWRILDDGKLWIGAEQWTSSSDEYTLLVHSPTDAHYELGVDVPTIKPGIDLAGVGKVALVEHRITGEDIRTFVWTQLDTDRGDAASITAMAKHALANIDYFTTYDCTVKSQSGDLATVDLNPPSDLKEIGGLQRVPLLHGLPGCKVQVPNQVTVSLGWYRGDPRLPYAALWPNDCGLTRLQLGGNTDAARKGDHSDDGTWVFTFVPGTGGATLSIVYTDPDGGVTTLGSGSGSVSAKGKINEGSSKVGLG